MSAARHSRRAVLAATVSAALCAAPGGLWSAAADTRMTATASLNVRSRPSTSAAIVGSLYRGQAVTAVSSANGWTRIRYGSSTAYVASRYLTAAGATSGTGTGRTTTAVNLRRGPGLSYGIVRVLPAGTRVGLTGQSARGYTEVTVDGRRGWVSSQYLTTGSTLPRTIGTRTATTALLVRTTSGADYQVVTEVPEGTRLAVTGVEENGRAQIVYRSRVRWVTERYLTPLPSGPSAPDLPKVTGVRYATADLLIRSAPTDAFTTVAEVPVGTALDITGVVRNGRMQVVFRGAARWVTARYLSATPPTGGIPPSWAKTEYRLRPNTIALHRAVRRTWPEITTIYGWRRDVTPDHPAGKALDLMIPAYRTAAGRDLGERIARWAQTNHRELKIEYIIWNQRIWSARRASEGWRYMASRGGDTANHKDHVHLNVLD